MSRREVSTHEISDGRLRKGAARREALLAATLRLIGRHGVGQVSQRSVATEAGVPPTTVLYYFSSVDELLVTTLREMNARYCGELGLITRLEELVEHLIRYADQDRDLLIAEFELWLLAARREDLREELHRWDKAVRSLAARLAPEPDAEGGDLLVAVLDGLYLRAASTGLEESTVRRVLADTVAGRSK